MLVCAACQFTVPLQPDDCVDDMADAVRRILQLSSQLRLQQPCIACACGFSRPTHFFLSSCFSFIPSPCPVIAFSAGKGRNTIVHKSYRGADKSLALRGRKQATATEDFDVHIHSFSFCLTTGPKPPPKRFLYIVRSRASSFK